MPAVTAVGGRILRYHLSEWKRIHSSFSVQWLCASCYCYLVREIKELQIPNEIQPREYSRDGGAGGSPHNRGGRERQPLHPLRQQQRQAVERQLELDRQQLQLQRSHRGLRQLAVDNDWQCFGGSSSVCELAKPSAEHSPNLVNLLRKRDIFFVVKRLDFPRDLREELEHIYFLRRVFQERKLFLFRRVACGYDALNHRYKKQINFPAERIARGLREMRRNLMPKFVRGHKLLGYGQNSRGGGGFLAEL